MVPSNAAANAFSHRLLPESGNVQRLVILLHGVASDASQLFRFAREWHRLLPNAAFVAPQAPQPCPGGEGGRQWFPLPSFAPDVRRAGVAAAAPALNALLDAERDRYQLRDADVAVVGFSQGALMALGVGLRRRSPVGAIVSFSGILVDADQPEAASLPASIISRPPVLLLHGADDELIPPLALELTSKVLNASRVPCQTLIMRGVGHAPGARGVITAGRFLARSFGMPERAHRNRSSLNARPLT